MCRYRAKKPFRFGATSASADGAHRRWSWMCDCAVSAISEERRCQAAPLRLANQPSRRRCAAIGALCGRRGRVGQAGVCVRALARVCVSVCARARETSVVEGVCGPATLTCSESPHTPPRPLYALSLSLSLSLCSFPLSIYIYV